VLHAIKTPTTADVTGGVLKALKEIVSAAGGEIGRVEAVMLGTTHFTNAVLQRRGLMRTAAVRIGLPASASLPPFVDWPRNLAGMVDGGVYMVEGGHEYDGRPLVDFNRVAMREVAKKIRDSGVRAAGVAAIFSPVNAGCEEQAAGLLREECPDIAITESRALGRIGLLERENATLLNACLSDLARHTTRAFQDAMTESGIDAPLYLTQNDGTVMRADFAAAFPVYSFASGPTNSMRGAAYLTGLDEAMVVDVGGTTTDVGHLRRGFPREANSTVEIGGVRTLFRMPDLLSIGLGGGSLVETAPLTIGPRSTGFRLPELGMVFGGDCLTMTDLAVAAGRAQIGDSKLVAHLDRDFVTAAMARASEMVAEAVDRMKVDATPVPLIAVGGGAFLVPDRMEGISEVVRVEHQAVANAVGAAIAQVSGEIDQIFADMTREAAIEEARRLANERAVEAGANPANLSTVEVEDLPIAYLPGHSLRVRIRVVGEIA
jgi:N-methylhydantoinase A/oxoprolinase/acetone carboxylase beta subunit